VAWLPATWLYEDEGLPSLGYALGRDRDCRANLRSDWTDTVSACAEAEASEPIPAHIAAKRIAANRAEEPFDETAAPRPGNARLLTVGTLQPGHDGLLRQGAARLVFNDHYQI